MITAGRVVEVPVLACAGLTKRYGGRTVVADLSLSVPAGQVYGLLGPNGAGKTTMISMIAGLVTPDAGEVRVTGQRVRPGAAELRGAVGLVPQEVALYPDDTAAENLRFFGRLYGLTGRALRTRVAEALELVGLADRAGDRVATFSGGMARRLNIAVGILPRPRLLILDEPTVGVDPQSRNAILGHVESFAAAGTAVLFASHYMEEVERLCQVVGIVDGGRMIASGGTGDLVRAHGGGATLTLRTAGDAAALARVCARVARVGTAVVGSVGGEREVQVRPAPGAEPGPLVPALLAAAAAARVPVTAVELAEPTLEEVFLTLTGRALRDESG